jgi:hypothetical protein
MQAIGMSPFVIAQHVSAATPNVWSSSADAIRQAQECNAIRHAQRRPSAISTSSSRSNWRRRVRASFNSRINHKLSSPHNKRMKFARPARPTRNGDAPLLAAYAPR